MSSSGDYRPMLMNSRKHCRTQVGKAYTRICLGYGRYDILRPDFELVLRHAGGLLFQEAHMQAQLDLNLFLPGLETPARIISDAGPTGTGVYFTPPAVARTLAEEALLCLSNSHSSDGESIQLFDPACGSGELLRECLRLLKLRRYHGQIKVTGWDSSPASIVMARFALHCEKRYWPRDQIQLDLVEHNSLTAPAWPTDVDILIMNPPFRSWQQMDSQTQTAVTTVLGSHLRNKPNLAMAFAIRAIDSVNSAGVLAMISPSSLFEASSGKQVREALSNRFTPVLIAKLGDQNIFTHALVDAGLYVGKRGTATGIPTAILWVNPEPASLSRALRGLRRWRGDEVNPLQEEGFSVHLQKQVGISSAPWVARSYDAWSWHERIIRSKKTVSASKLFDIHQGVRLGSDVFIVGRKYVKDLSASEQRFFRPAVMNVSLKDARLNDDYYVFYPYTTGLPPLRNEEDLSAQVPTFYAEVLLPAKPALESRRSLIREQLNWWDLIWPRNWQHGPAPKLVSKYFGDTRPFAFDGTGDYVVVVGHAWLRRKGEVEVAITDAELYLAMIAYLNSSIVSALLEYLSVQISGGQFDLSNKFLTNLPVLNIAKINEAHLVQLVRIGRELTEGRLERWADVDELMTEVLAL
jgi:adenine-specific DNA-methyltransferase